MVPDVPHWQSRQVRLPYRSIKLEGMIHAAREMRVVHACLPVNRVVVTCRSGDVDSSIVPDMEPLSFYVLKSREVRWRLCAAWALDPWLV